MQRSFLFLVWLTTLLLPACNREPAGNSVRARLWSQVKLGGPVRIEDATTFAWDEVVVLRPYVSREEAERLISARWPGYDASGIAIHDSINVLIFLRHGSIVHEEVLSRKWSDFDVGNSGRRITKVNAVFDVIEKQGWNYLRLQGPGEVAPN